MGQSTARTTGLEREASAVTTSFPVLHLSNPRLPARTEQIEKSIYSPFPGIASGYPRQQLPVPGHADSPQAMVSVSCLNQQLLEGTAKCGAMQ